jgi:hypothetical protein
MKLNSSSCVLARVSRRTVPRSFGRVLAVASVLTIFAALVACSAASAKVIVAGLRAQGFVDRGLRGDETVVLSGGCF